MESLTGEQIRASGAFRFVDARRRATSVQVWDLAGDRAGGALRGFSPECLGRSASTWEIWLKARSRCPTKC